MFILPFLVAPAATLSYGFLVALWSGLTTSPLRRFGAYVQLFYPHFCLPIPLAVQLYRVLPATRFFEPRIGQFLAEVPPHSRKVAFLSGTQSKGL